LDLRRWEYRVSVTGARLVSAEQRGLGGVQVHVDLEPVEQDALGVAHRALGARRQGRHMHQHRRAGGGREVAGEGGDELVDARQAGLVEGVEVELERLGLDQVGRTAGTMKWASATTGLPRGRARRARRRSRCPRRRRAARLGDADLVALALAGMGNSRAGS
jgi:hypothetical protein